jgi:hypothetical protein
MNKDESIVVNQPTAMLEMAEKIIQTQSTKMSEKSEITEKSQQPKIKSDIQEEIDMINSQYVYDCVGSPYGCPEKTNGSQYCSKYYCPYEEIMHEN